ncbi:MAG: 50S ribosomal protein L32 [Candidatus Hydrogenedentota bacterium]
MSLPKRRHSKTRGRKRRTGDSVMKPTLTRCPECGASIEPHRACAKCGAWKGSRNAIKTKKKAV